MLKIERIYRDLIQSFETGEQGTFKVYFAKRTKIDHIRAFVIKPIAGTDNGTLTFKNSTGSSMSGGLVTATASDPISTAYLATPTTNNEVAAGDYIQIVAAKTTAGGRLQVMIDGHEF